MGAWGEGLLESDAALDGAGDALESRELGEHAAYELAFILMCSVRELDELLEHHAVKLPQAELAALKATASSAAHSAPLGELIGNDETFGPRLALLARPEAAKALRGLRDHIAAHIDEGWDPAEANNGPLALLLQLREVGCATPPDLVTEWRETAERVLEGDEPSDPARVTLAALKLLAKPLPTGARTR